MSGRRYTDEYKAEAVKQVLEKGHSTPEVAVRLGINKHSLYDWVQRAKRGPVAVTTGVVVTEGSDAKELRRLRAELKRVTEERDILKKAAVSSTRQCNMIHSCTDGSALKWLERAGPGCPRLRSGNCGVGGGAGNHSATLRATSRRTQARYSGFWRRREA